MIAALPRLFVVRLLGALLLLAAGLQAGAPIGAVLERSHGSAFSASTHEVAVATSRRAEVSRVAISPQPVMPPRIAHAALPLARTAHPRLPAPKPDSTGPPALDILARLPDPRGPPTA